jgi:hypothetical protein
MAGNMINRRTRIDLRPPSDTRFRAAIERACIAASLTGVELDTPDAARIVRDEVRSDGYPNAEISVFRTVEEFRNRVSNWIVWRDGRPARRPSGVRQRVRIDRAGGQETDPATR